MGDFWGPIASILFEKQSSDEVLNILNSAGLTGIAATGSDAYSHSTRKRAYKAQFFGILNKFDAQERLRTVELVVWDLIENDGALLLKLNEKLAGVGWTFRQQHLFRIGEPVPPQGAFFKKGESHDAYVHIRTIVKSGTSDRMIIDPFLDDSTYILLKTIDLKSLRVRILARERNLPSDFLHEGEKFFDQHTTLSSFETRTTDDIHDRFIVVDNRQIFLLGASIKDAGKKAFAIVPIENDRIARFIFEYLQDVWVSSTELLARSR